MMEAPLKPKYQEALDGWLERATKFLCPEAKRRIRRDIEEHYLGVFDRWIEAGRSEDEAHAMGMKSLGSSLKASWRFEETHLSKEEGDELRGVLARTVNFKTYLGCWILALTIGLVLYFNSARSDGMQSAIFLLISFLPHIPAGLHLPLYLRMTFGLSPSRSLLRARQILISSHGVAVILFTITNVMVLRTSETREQWLAEYGEGHVMMLFVIPAVWAVGAFISTCILSYLWEVRERKLAPYDLEEFRQKKSDA